MDSSVPYLIRAINEWILDNNCTPYLIVDVKVEGVSAPMAYAKEGQIVLNISPTATRHLAIGNDAVSFSGRFGGVAHEIYAPIDAVLGIIAKENGEGMWFPKEKSGPGGPKPPTAPRTGPRKGPPSLKVVK